MPKVLIISDSHGWTKEVEMVKARHQDHVDQMIHCGDSELDYDETPMNNFVKVKGNCDFDDQYPEEVDFSVKGLHFFVAHGHMHQVKMTLMPISYRASEVGATIICHGHSHIAAAQRINDQIIINPGSIHLPRVRREKTYAILSWDDNGNYQVDFYDLEGQIVEDLSFDTTIE
ncbi:putative phosphoesterase [Natronobacillus azotifigens]|uniref:Phosphoesterase n=1 Tax=Natronobacillus azotifigens TaxID=472978 RepID=A0A9J6RG18_9BACI|nr:metallophosphoesterase [Natronobacillus azotifigens]MCZ0704552.1 metallophosphoesterase [Natronobacillus azotifigens]